jgi:hypothetical protein
VAIYFSFHSRCIVSQFSFSFLLNVFFKIYFLVLFHLSELFA